VERTWRPAGVQGRHGHQYDDVIRSVATSIGPKDVFHARNRLAGLASDGMADCGPLQRLVAKYITPEILAAIAREYRKGRVLQIGTTDLDAGRAVTWNMGAITSSDAPGALELFRKIMVWHSDVVKARMSDDSSHCPQDPA
jgi:hypothetical protein